MPQRAERPHASVHRTLIAVLREPAAMLKLTPSELDLVLRTARRARLLGRLADRMDRHGSLEALPEAAREQLASAAVVVRARSRVARWELNRMRWAFRAQPGLRVVVLKGCAYLLARLPNAAGRGFADVDLMFDERQLATAERTLVARGWQSTKLDAYDQHYYRVWTHELPPLVHPEREVEADLHHNILPRTSRLKPSGASLFNNARRIDGEDLYRLADDDLVLHAMTHLMFDSDLADSLRDLVDVGDLLEHFAAARPDFWVTLWERAETLDLARPAFYSLRYAHALIGTPVPDAALRMSRAGAPPRVVVWLMDRLVPRALFPQHPDAPSGVTVIARFALYVRSLWIRMPPWLLARHLAYKFYVRRIRRGAAAVKPVADSRADPRSA